MSNHDSDREPGDEPEMDALDRLIVAAAQDYHRPPVRVPREAMWDAIVAERRAGGDERRADVIPIAGVPRAPRPSRFAPRSPLWLIAAGILLATGIGIGRWSSRSPGFGDVGGATASSALTARSGADTSAPDSARPGAAAVPEGVAVASADGPEPRGLDVGERGRRLAAPFGGIDGAGQGGAAPDGAYDDVAVRHFTAAEALLVAFRREPAAAPAALPDSLAAVLDARLSVWARQLLQDTRLLLDSPAGADPRRRQLLEDLELVLAQITRLGAAEAARPAGGVAERELIDGTIKRGQVLTRLRNNVPAGV